MLFMFLLFMRVILSPIPSEEYCKIKFGEGFEPMWSWRVDTAKRCMSVDYESGDAIIKYYDSKDIYNYCNQPKFFALNKWKWECLEDKTEE